MTREITPPDVGPLLPIPGTKPLTDKQKDPNHTPKKNSPEQNKPDTPDDGQIHIDEYI